MVDEAFERSLAPQYRSYWLRQAGRDEPAPALEGRTRADVAIVGGGYTGLWTAHFLKEADGLTVTFKDGTLTETFLSWKGFQQLLGMKTGKTKKPASPPPAPNPTPAVPPK